VTKHLETPQKTSLSEETQQKALGKHFSPLNCTFLHFNSKYETCKAPERDFFNEIKDLGAVFEL